MIWYLKEVERREVSRDKPTNLADAIGSGNGRGRRRAKAMTEAEATAE
jgi:hypothetical protein